MDLATMTAAPTTLVVGGRTFKVGPLRYLDLGVIQRHLNEACRSPLAELQAAGDATAEELAEARKASRGWRPPVVGQDAGWVDALFRDADGVALFLNLLFSKHEQPPRQDRPDVRASLFRRLLDLLGTLFGRPRPNFGPEDLAHVMAHVGPRQMRPLFLIAMEEPADPPAAGGDPGPKADPGPSTT